MLRFARPHAIAVNHKATYLIAAAKPPALGYTPLLWLPVIGTLARRETLN